MLFCVEADKPVSQRGVSKNRKRKRYDGLQRGGSGGYISMRLSATLPEDESIQSRFLPQYIAVFSSNLPRNYKLPSSSCIVLPKVVFPLEPVTVSTTGTLLTLITNTDGRLASVQQA